MNKVKLEIYADYVALSRAASERFFEVAKRAISIRDRFLVVLSGGDTPRGLYRNLSAPPYIDELDWQLTHVFWSDERRVDRAVVLSNYYQARVSLLDKISIPSNHVHKIKSNIDTAKSAASYAKVLYKFKNPPLEWPRFDLILLGLGMDGHTASIFPGSPLQNTLAVIPTSGEYDDRPSKRITMTPEVINSGREVLFLVSGAEKSAILARVLEGRANPEALPAQRIQPLQGNLTWMVDQDAAIELRNRSV